MFARANSSIRFLLFIGISLLILSACTQTDKTVQLNKLIHLSSSTNAATPNVFFLMNRSASPIIIDIPPDQHRGASAGWASLLQPQHRSAIVIGNKDLTLACFKPKTYQQIPCRQHVTVVPASAAEKQKLKLDPQGGYWLFENKPSNSE